MIIILFYYILLLLFYIITVTLVYDVFISQYHYVLLFPAVKNRLRFHYEL